MLLFKLIFCRFSSDRTGVAIEVDLGTRLGDVMPSRLLKKSFFSTFFMHTCRRLGFAMVTPIYRKSNGRPSQRNAQICQDGTKCGPIIARDPSDSATPKLCCDTHEIAELPHV